MAAAGWPWPALRSPRRCSPLLARGRLRAALTPGIVAAGAVGYGGVILLQNVGIAHTSVSHAALIVGAVPVLVAIIVGVLGRSAAGPLAWAGSLLALAGVGLVAGSGGAGTALSGDLLVLLSVTGSAAFIVLQPGLLAGRDPAAVTAVQLAAGGVASLPFAIIFEGAPPAPAAAGPVVAVLALALTGTALAFWLFAWAQSHVPAELASAFVNLEPLVGTLTGVVAFQRRVRPGAARRRHGDPRRHRARRDAAAQAPTSRSVGRRGRSRRSDRRPGAWPPIRCRPPHRAPAGLRYRPCPSPPNPDRPHSRVPHHRPARPRA